MKKNDKKSTAKSPKIKKAIDKVQAQMTQDAERAGLAVDPPAPVVVALVDSTKAVKGQLTLDDGKVIAVRGVEKRRAMYGHEGSGDSWQDHLRSCRVALWAAFSALQIGVADAIASSLVADADAAIEKLHAGRVTVPKDMFEMHMAIKSGNGDQPVGSPLYAKSLRKLTGICRDIVDPEKRHAIEIEIAAAAAAARK